ncbi:MAG TPA: DinB family protein [Pedobacter sp.]|jgi:hypothetical protein
MKLNKKELLDYLRGRVEKHIGTAVSLFQNLPKHELLRPSPTGGWSVAQCLDHLNSYGLYYLPRLQTVLGSAPASDNLFFKSGWLGNYFTKMMEPSPKKYKAFKGHIPDKALSAYAVVEEFIKQQEELLELLRAFEARSLNRRIPISISDLIRLKTGDVFRFLIAHNERHVQQALRTIAKQEIRQEN